MKETKLKILSNIIFVISIALSVYLLIKTYINKRNLPDGICPIDNNRNLMYFTIALLFLYLIISFFDDYKKKKTGKKE